MKKPTKDEEEGRGGSRGGILKHSLPLLTLALILFASASLAQDSPRVARLSDEFFKSGGVTLRSFMPVGLAARDSVVRLDLDGRPVALGTVIEINGFILTKASELGDGHLTCTLASGTRVEAKVVAVDEENDVALVRARATGLKPIKWASQGSVVGQWAVTPGLDLVPEAVGVVSVPPRKILHKRAIIGVQLDLNAAAARIAQVTAGLGAEKAGMKAGDVVLAINNQIVASGLELREKLRNFRDGQTVKFRVRRDQQEFDLTVEMAEEKRDPTDRGTRRQDRMNHLGTELSERAEGFTMALQHDTVLQPWQCGGPLVNLEGKALGLNIARAGRTASYALPAPLVRQIIVGFKTRPTTAVKNRPPIRTVH